VNLRGHLKGDDEEDNGQTEGGSSSYVPPEKDKDVQYHYGLDVLRGIKSVDTAKKKTEAD
jgi:carboxyl-terminal processing protease